MESRRKAKVPDDDTATVPVDPKYDHDEMADQAAARENATPSPQARPVVTADDIENIFAHSISTLPVAMLHPSRVLIGNIQALLGEGDATDLSEEQYYEFLVLYDQLEDLIEQGAAYMKRCQDSR